MQVFPAHTQACTSFTGPAQRWKLLSSSFLVLKQAWTSFTGLPWHCGENCFLDLHCHLRVVGTNNRADAKVCKKLLSWNNLGNYFDDPNPLTGSVGCGYVYIAARRPVYCTQEAVLSQRAARCGLHNSVKLGLCSLELNFSLFCDILGEWTWP